MTSEEDRKVLKDFYEELSHLSVKFANVIVPKDYREQVSNLREEVASLHESVLNRLSRMDARLTYEVWCRRRDRKEDYLVSEIRACSHEGALSLCGFKVDMPGGHTCGAEPRDEYGRPDYPYFEAIPKLNQ